MSSTSAVVRIQDVQFRVQENDHLRVPRLSQAVGETVEFDQVLLLGGDEVRVGNPTVAGARVRAEVLEHARDRKIRIFRMKRRKGFRKTIGHRQQYTAIRITAIEA